MRTMLKLKVPVETGNEAVRSGRFAEVIGALVERLNPEAAYFYADDGNRGACFVFDMDDSSVIPVFAEPLFVGLDARLDLVPVMNLEDLQKGLAELQAQSG
jgi:hypothetical protein